jgi:hypothetical protein
MIFHVRDFILWFIEFIYSFNFKKIVYNDGDHEWISRSELDDIACDIHYDAFDDDQLEEILAVAHEIRVQEMKNHFDLTEMWKFYPSVVGWFSYLTEKKQ